MVVEHGHVTVVDQRKALEIQLRGDQRPTAIEFTDAIAVGNSYVLIVGCRSIYTQDMDSCAGIPWRVGRYQKDRNAFVALGWIRVGPCRQPDVLAERGATGPDFLPIDDPIIAIAHCSGTQIGQIAACARL
ncbi:hypothetical protein D9M71_783850 [compost metagenome]